ncbi:ATP-binding protein [Simplicispira lacusdiani]|uniref:ATP-binding protein n=1 Tax=Simplicispira lacusdiani TaxID=2213010 RepID=UPI0018E54802|nr:ATP-binding protein [Simplicispira lacusdiani]
MLNQCRAWRGVFAVREAWRAVGLCLLALWLSAPAWGAEKVRVGVYQNSPKVSMSASGKAEGIFIDLIEGIAASEGWEIEYVAGTWTEGLERLGRGEIDLMPDVARNQEREALYAFHQEPVLSSWNQVYARRGSGVRSMLDLEGKRVAVLAGSVQERQFEQMASSFSLVVEWMPLPDFDAAFAAVEQGHADAVVTNRFFGVRNALRYGLEDTAIIFSPSKLYFAAPLGGRQDLLQAIDRRLIAFKKDSNSLYYKSLRRWSVDEVRAATPGWLLPVVAAFMAALMAAVAGVLLLRRQVALRTAELRQRNQEMQTINDILRAIGGRRDLDGVLQEATRGAMALSGFDGGVLCLRDASRGSLRVGARLHALPLVDHFDDGMPLCDAGCPAMLDVVGNDKRHALLSADDPGAHTACGNVRDPSVRWNAYFALQVQERTLGVLCLFSRQADPPQSEVLKLVEDLCGPVALAVENAHLYQQAQEHAQELERRVEDRTHALAQAMHRAEDADRIKSAFLATMSHELRTPLNSIIGFTGILLQGLAGPLNPEQGKQLGMVRDSARHLLALINDVLDISKIEAGELRVGCAPFDLARSIQKVGALIAPLADKKHLALDIQVAPGIGTMASDERRVEQVLLNLLSNAVKFTDSGSVTLRAEPVEDFRPVGAPGPVDAVRLSVTDTGPGIKEEDMALLFTPFRQIDSTLARKHEGTGLGLTICQRMVGLMGGSIEARSTWGQGSTFTVTLPLQAVPMEETA